MAGLQQDLDLALVRLRRAGTDLQSVEVKAATGGLPRSVLKSVAAFSNTRGGLVVLGLDETAGFEPVAIDTAKVAADLASACADQLDPPIRPVIDVCQVDGQPVVVAAVDEIGVDRKPCFVQARGMESGSYVRTHDGDRQLTSYEVHVMVSGRGQPREDHAVVPGATPDDLDPDLVRALASRLRATRGPVFAQADDTDVLRRLGIVVDGPDGPGVTLAGLLALGDYPQRFVPQLDITFVAYPTTSGAALDDGTRFLDNQSVDGPIPVMVDTALAVLRRNLRRSAVVTGAGRQDRWEYPLEALREIVANALMHRDYHPLSQGSQVRIELYPDRVEVSSPGGLFGSVAREDLLAERVSSSRNSLLAKVLEDVEIRGTGRTVCENRGTGLLAAADALRAAGMEPPQLDDVVREFRVVLRNHGLLDAEALTWLAGLDAEGLNDRQKLCLAYLRRSPGVTNQQYRSLTGCDPLTATRELRGLADHGLVVKTNDRRWAVWSLAEPPTQASLPDGDPSAGHDPDVRRTRTDRRDIIRALLAAGPRTTQEMAIQIGVGPGGVRHWLRRMESEGEVRRTAASTTASTNRWELTQQKSPGTDGERA